MLLLNAFSLNMIDGNADVIVREVSLKTAASLAADAISAVGHADTAAVFESVLGVPVPCNRVSVTLKEGDVALVGQYSGPRLPEGATSLPEGATIKWMVVAVKEPLLVDLRKRQCEHESMKKARKLRASLLSNAAGEFQGLPEAVSIPTNSCVLTTSAVDSEVGVLQTLLANQTLCLPVVNGTLCNNTANHHAVHERINIQEHAAEVLK